MGRQHRYCPAISLPSLGCAGLAAIAALAATDASQIDPRQLRHGDVFVAGEQGYNVIRPASAGSEWRSA
jgi:hypothetical protein